MVQHGGQRGFSVSWGFFVVGGSAFASPAAPEYSPVETDKTTTIANAKADTRVIRATFV
jgi:hypothetical protein